MRGRLTVWQGRWHSGEVALGSEGEKFGFVGHDRDQSLIEVALYRHKDCLCKVGTEISDLDDL